MSRPSAPRLVLVADEPQFAEPMAGAMFSFHVAKFLAEVARQPQLQQAHCAVWLRAHGHGWSWWSDQLQRLAWLGQTALSVGISAPVACDRELPPADLPFALKWLQVSEAQALAWPCGDLPVARSCHDAAGAAQALAAGAAWVTLSPVRPTPSKPGHPGLGWAAFAETAQRFPGQVVALGGLTALDVADAWPAGAAGVAVLRAWTVEPSALVAALAHT